MLPNGVKEFKGSSNICEDFFLGCLQERRNMYFSIDFSRSLLEESDHTEGNRKSLRACSTKHSGYCTRRLATPFSGLLFFAICLCQSRHLEQLGRVSNDKTMLIEK